CALSNHLAGGHVEHRGAAQRFPRAVMHGPRYEPIMRDELTENVPTMSHSCATSVALPSIRRDASAPRTNLAARPVVIIQKTVSISRRRASTHRPTVSQVYSSVAPLMRWP